MRHHAKFCAIKRSNSCGNMAIFSIWLPSGILHCCYTPVWTTHEEYLEVFVSLQNLVRIGAVVLITCQFQYFVRYA